LTSPACRRSLSAKFGLKTAIANSLSGHSSNRDDVRPRVNSSKASVKVVKVTKPFSSCSEAKRDRDKSVPSTVNYYCGGCGVLFEESTGGWIRCVGCLEWWEIDCAGLLGKPKSQQDEFRCTDCCE